MAGTTRPVRGRGRASSVALLFGVAALAGAGAAFVGAVFIFVVEQAVALVWEDLPGALGVEPFGVAWTLAIPVLGGALVGLGSRYLGDYPTSLEETLQRWRSGAAPDPKAGPASAVNSLAALAAGGPLGFEAALTSVLGATVEALHRRVRAAGHLVREAWGADRIEGLPRWARSLPAWTSALVGLATFLTLPFGTLDLGFRLEPAEGWAGPRVLVVAAVVAAAAAVPSAWAVAVVRRAEHAGLHHRAPVLSGMVGGLLFAVLALGDSYVLFSGQQALAHIAGLGTGSLLYLALAKWAALVIALVAGWRGGPFFPLFLAVSSLAVAVHGPLGVEPELAVAAAIAAVSVVIVRGRVLVGFVLALYVVPLGYAGTLLVGAAAAAGVLALGARFALVPRPPEQSRRGGARSG